MDNIVNLFDNSLIRCKFRQLSKNILNLIDPINLNDINFALNEQKIAWYYTNKDFYVIAYDDLEPYNFYSKKLESVNYFLYKYLK